MPDQNVTTSQFEILKQDETGRPAIIATNNNTPLTGKGGLIEHAHKSFPDVVAVGTTTEDIPAAAGSTVLTLAYEDPRTKYEDNCACLTVCELCF